VSGSSHSNAQPSRNNVPLNLGSARVQRASDGVAHSTFKFEFGQEPCASVYLNGVERGFHKRLGNTQRGHGRVHVDRFIPALTGRRILLGWAFIARQKQRIFPSITREHLLRLAFDNIAVELSMSELNWFLL
jgi:hypothetical protein